MESHLNVHVHASFSDSEGTLTSSSEVSSHGNRRSISDTFERVDASRGEDGATYGAMPCEGDADDSVVRS